MDCAWIVAKWEVDRFLPNLRLTPVIQFQVF
jgi:hypothetical protein